MKNNIFDSMVEKTFSQKEGVKNMKKEIIQLSNWVVETIKNNGRVIFVGAGISSEIPRAITEELWFNFSLEKEKFIIISAAKNFIMDIEHWKELEEISSISIFELDELNLSKNDLVIGITCSGKTEYVIGAIKYANDLNCKTAMITENINISVESKPNLILCSKLNSPTIFGLCSAEGGTIQKMITDLVVYSAMEQMGRIWKGYLIFMKPVSKKLQDYCIFTIMKLLKTSRADAEKLFEKNNRKLEQTILAGVKNLSSNEAEKLLKNNEYDFLKLIS